MSTYIASEGQCIMALTELQRVFQVDDPEHGPKLMPEGWDGDRRVIVWESGFDWPYELLDHEMDLPDGVWLEPVNHYSVTVWVEV